MSVIVHQLKGASLTYSLFEKTSLLQSQGVGFRNDWHYVDYFSEFFENHNVNLILCQLQSLSAFEIVFDSQVSKCDPWG